MRRKFGIERTEGREHMESWTGGGQVEGEGVKSLEGGKKEPNVKRKHKKRRFRSA